MSRIESAINDISVLEDIAGRDTWLNRIDPRAKSVVTVLFVAMVASFESRAVLPLLPFAAYPLFMTVGGDLPFRIFRRPLTVALCLAVLIAAANPLLDTEPVRLTAGIAVRRGWFSFASIIMRAVLCVTAATVLIATTGMERLCRGLSRMRVPDVIVVQLLFLYRYSFLLGSNAVSMTRARELRSNGRPLPMRVYGSLTGHLLLRTLDRAERIHDAMRCRGFNGTVPVLNRMSFGVKDVFFTVLCAAVFCLMRWPHLITEGVG